MFFRRCYFKNIVVTLLPFGTILVLIGFGIHVSLHVPLDSRSRRDVTADDAEIYQNAAVAADTITCSELGKGS